MREFAAELEADLLFRGIDVADWHQGRMSSRRLLVLAAALPPDSAFAQARRQDWSEQEYAAWLTLNELRLLRADQCLIHTREKLDVTLVRSPGQERQAKIDAEKRAAAREAILKQLYKR